MIYYRYSKGTWMEGGTMGDDCTCATCGKTMAYDDAFTHMERDGEMLAFCSRACLEKSESQA